MQTTIQGVVARLLSKAGNYVDGVGAPVNLRAGPHGELRTLNSLSGMQASADEGAYFVASNPTPGTAIATTTSITAYTAVSPVCVLQNNDVLGGSNIIFDYLSLEVAQVPTSAQFWEYALVADTTKRYSSAGSQITQSNAHTGATQASIAQFYFGAIVASAASSGVRIISRGSLRTAVPVIRDQFVFRAGSHENGFSGSLSNGTNALNVGLTVPPLVLAPQTSMLLYMWGTANAAAPSFEFSAGWIER